MGRYGVADLIAGSVVHHAGCIVNPDKEDNLFKIIEQSKVVDLLKSEELRKWNPNKSTKQSEKIIHSIQSQ